MLLGFSKPFFIATVGLQVALDKSSLVLPQGSRGGSLHASRQHGRSRENTRLSLQLGVLQTYLLAYRHQHYVQPLAQLVASQPDSHYSRKMLLKLSDIPTALLQDLLCTQQVHGGAQGIHAMQGPSHHHVLQHPLYNQ